MRKILDYTIPPIKCFLHQAFPLGIFWDENDQNIMNWFCLNYNYILGGTRPNDYFYTFLMNFSSIPFLQKREIYGDELELYLTTHSFSTFVKEEINNGNLVEVLADIFYLKGTGAYNKEHFMHEILILGYDDEKDTFIIRDYYRRVFREIEVSQSQIVPFENCSYYGDNVVIKLYRKKDNYFPFDSKSFVLQLKDYYDSINPFYRISCVHGTYFEPWEKAFGMEVYDRIIDYLEAFDSIDYRPLRMIQEHFNGMQIKLNYIKKQHYMDLNCLDETINYYTESANKAEKMVRLALKQTIVSNDKKEQIKQRIISQLKELIDSERIYLKVFLDEADNRTNYNLAS